MTKVIKYVAVVLAVGFLVNSYSSCTLSKKLKEAEKAYIAARQNATKQNELAQKQIAKLQNDRLETEYALGEATQTSDKLGASNAVLKKRWAEEKKQKVATIAQAARREEIAQNLIDGLGKEVCALKLQINTHLEINKNLELELNTWKQMYEDEHAVHLKLQNLYKGMKLYKKWNKIGFGFFAGIGYDTTGSVHPTAGFGVTIRL